MQEAANRHDRRPAGSSSVWLHALLLVALCCVVLLPVSVTSVLATHALGLLYMLLALAAAARGHVRVLPAAAAAIGACLLAFMSHSFATGLSDRELSSRLAAGISPEGTVKWRATLPYPAAAPPAAMGERVCVKCKDVGDRTTYYLVPVDAVSGTVEPAIPLTGSDR